MKFFKRTDIVIIAVILLVQPGPLWIIYDHLVKDISVKAEIYYYSELVETVELDGGEERTFSIPQTRRRYSIWTRTAASHLLPPIVRTRYASIRGGFIGSANTRHVHL